MSKIDATVRPGDERPIITATLTDSAGQPVDLTGATVKLVIRGATVHFTRTEFTAVGAAAGAVSYEWGTDPGLPVIAGLYFSHWRVTYAFGDDETFPNGTNGGVLELITD